MSETGASDLQQAYAETVRAVVDSAPDVMEGEWGDRTWRQIVVNYETLLHSDDPRISDISFAVAQRPDEPLELVDFRLSRAAKTGFERISALAFARDGGHFTTCDLMIEADRAYRFDFGYGPPYRLSGQVHDTRFDDYLTRYLAETGS